MKHLLFISIVLGFTSTGIAKPISPDDAIKNLNQETLNFDESAGDNCTVTSETDGNNFRLTLTDSAKNVSMELVIGQTSKVDYSTKNQNSIFTEIFKIVNAKSVIKIEHADDAFMRVTAIKNQQSLTCEVDF